jgi:WD40 repeat protein
VRLGLEAVGSLPEKFKHIALRTALCVSDGHPVLASASSTGHIALWDLNSGGRLLHIIRGAHDGAVSAVEWVPGQPVLISSGEDNSIKVNLRHFDKFYLVFCRSTLTPLLSTTAMAF